MKAPKEFTPLKRAQMTLEAIHQANIEGTSIPLIHIEGELELARTTALVSLAASMERISQSDLFDSQRLSDLIFSSIKYARKG